MKPLITAVLRKDAAGVGRLLKEGANPSEPDPDDPDERTPLMHAVLNGDAETTAVLVKSGADVNAVERRGWTALHFAAQDFQVQCADLLLNAHAKVDAQDEYGNSPLWRAAFGSRGRGGMIQLLLKFGADANLRNKSGKSPRELAHTIANYDVKQFFGA